MVKVHEIDLTSEEFQSLLMNSFLIIEQNTLEYMDYVLFRELAPTQPEPTPPEQGADSPVETQNDEPSYTGEYRMTQIVRILEDDGLKEGFVMINFSMF